MSLYSSVCLLGIDYVKDKNASLNTSVNCVMSVVNYLRLSISHICIANMHIVYGERIEFEHRTWLYIIGLSALTKHVIKEYK